MTTLCPAFSRATNKAWMRSVSKPSSLVRMILSGVTVALFSPRGTGESSSAWYVPSMTDTEMERSYCVNTLYSLMGSLSSGYPTEVMGAPKHKPGNGTVRPTNCA